MSIYWIEGPWPGRLAIVARPRGDDWLKDDVRQWKRDGIDAVVSLLMPQEAAELSLEAEQQLVETNGIRFYSLPITDRGVPPLSGEVQTLIASLAQQLSAGKTIAIHCRHGIGRSALLAAGLLVQSGINPETAFSQIETARGRSVPDTVEQRAWVERFAALEAIPLW
jgi:protein-tyrosine phosphatase